MSCEQAVQIHRYHDGDLSPTQRAQVQMHISHCADCRELLGDLENLSSLFATVPLPEVTTRAVNRMQGSWWAAARQAQESSIRRFATLMTAVAAVVLLFISTANPSQNHQVEEAGIWADTLALIPSSEMRESPSADLVEVAQWMANDVNPEQRQ